MLASSKRISLNLFQYSRFQSFLKRKDLQLISFFSFLFFVIILRLFWLQIIKHEEYDHKLSQQHYRESQLTPERGNIFLLDKGGHPVKLTENITLYDLALDPKELQWNFESDPDYKVPSFLRGKPMKKRFIDLIVPVVYKHLCEINGMKQVSKEECVKNVGLFAGIQLFPNKPELFYYGSGFSSPEYQTFDFSGYNAEYQKVLNEFTKLKALELIRTKLTHKIQIGKKDQNYLGYFVDEPFLKEVEALDLPYLRIKNKNYLYIVSSIFANQSSSVAKKTVKKLLQKWKYPIPANFDALFEQQEWRYIKIISGLNPALAQEVRELKKNHLGELSSLDKSQNKLTRTPVLFSLVLEPYTSRYYPYGDFLANVLGYVDKKGNAFYGIEEYFDSILKGKKGEIRGRTSAWLGNVGSNEFEITSAIDGSDIYLTIDMGLQKEIERIAKNEIGNLRADWLSILVLNTQNGEVKASVNAPSFDPNNYNDAYTMIPLSLEHKFILDDLSYVDVPVYIYTGGTYRKATLAERAMTGEKKYLTKNIYGSQVFVDKSISSPFEPGSIVKAFTVGIGLDTDEVSFQDRYTDEGFVKIDKYTIKNASNECLGNHDFLHAFSYSCNVGMVRIVQTVGKFVFYNYLQRLGFGALTNIELAGEKEGTLGLPNIVSRTQFFNNAFGQGLLMTQIQLAIAYASLVNGGVYYSPTIIENILDKQNPLNLYTKKYYEYKVFKSETSSKLKDALHYIISTNAGYQKANLVDSKLGAKSGTSQVAFKGKYRGGEGWTNGTFAGIVTTDHPKYVVLIWIRRPRSNQWGGNTAGPIFKQIAQYILNYDL